jgi:hypothetical protein
MWSTTGNDTSKGAVEDSYLTPAVRREIALGIIIGLLSFCLVLVSTLYFWGIVFWKGPIDYTHFGNWGDAISGVATTAAVIVALVSLFRERAIRLATQRERAIEAEASVYLWLTSHEVRDQHDVKIGREWNLKVHNSTAAPIFRWLVTLDASHPHICSFNKGPLLPGENLLNIRSMDNVAPNQIPDASLMFEGRSGRSWQRTAKGVLREETTKALICEHWPSGNTTNAGPSR